MPDITSGIQRANVTLEAMEAVGEDLAAELHNETATSVASFAKGCEDNVNPFARVLSNVRKKIEARGPHMKKAEEAKGKSAQLLPIKDIEEKAQGFQQRNPSLKSGHLVLLRTNIKPDDKAQDIIDTVTRFYPDVGLADEALQFLLETTEGDLQEQVKEAIKLFREAKGPEIEAGRNVARQAAEATEKGLGTHSNLDDLYKDIKDNERDSATLFNQLSQKYDFKETKAVMDYLLHTLGASMKVKGTTIPRPELQRLITATRSLQAIGGVYSYFKKRMPLVEKMFKEQGMQVPPKLNFESLSKVFMTLVTERYPSSDRVKKQAVQLGVDDSTLGKIVAFNQCRDGIREVALNQIYRSIQHRDELYMAILEALEDFEEEFEDSLGQEEIEVESQKGV